MLNTLKHPSAELDEWLVRTRGHAAWSAPVEVSRRVGEILSDVQANGDEALVRLSNELDARKVTDVAELKVPAEKLREACDALEPELRAALELAHKRIHAYHSAERKEHQSWSHTDRLGVVQGRIVRPLNAAGVYVPGGQASYPSSVLMNLVPARVAGVARCLLCSPWPQGEYRLEVLAAAHLAECAEFWSLGGAVAIAAMAFGTETMQAVDLVAGPGNIWVAEAKRQVYGQVGVDLLAGPSEVLVIADETARADWVAADLCAQAEHDPMARAILVTDDVGMLEAVQEQLTQVVPSLERREIVAQSLAEQGAAILVEDLERAVAISNRLAPEHLQLAVNLPAVLMEQVEHAGAVFLGHSSAEVYGDYLAGSNHVLPTGGTARFFSPLGVGAFMTETAFVECPSPAASALSAATQTLARAEGLTAHARSAALREAGFGVDTQQQAADDGDD